VEKGRCTCLQDPSHTLASKIVVNAVLGGPGVIIIGKVVAARTRDHLGSDILRVRGHRQWSQAFFRVTVSATHEKSLKRRIDGALSELSGNHNVQAFFGEVIRSPLGDRLSSCGEWELGPDRSIRSSFKQFERRRFGLTLRGPGHSRNQLGILSRDCVFSSHRFLRGTVSASGRNVCRLMIRC
jgi:hypothetical protein